MDVLIVDDQRPFRSVARTVVNLVGGWRVAAEAETGEDAVDAAERVRPGVVLMDINLPGISGIEATRRIVASHPGTRVVLLSTYAVDLMNTHVFGNVNLGVLLGLGQFVTTFLITQLYVAYSATNTDPIADEMRGRLEAHEYRSEGQQ